MKFELVNILDKMQELYKLPKSQKRFEEYLLLLQGESKGELLLPIAGYNPMGNEYVLQKLEELIALEAEALVAKELAVVNESLKKDGDPQIAVVLNLVDDLGGAWSNYYTTDYTSKFELSSLVKRNFCAPYFWTGEQYSEALIVQRTREYVYRTYYWIAHGKPISLADHLNQEVFVQAKANKGLQVSNAEGFPETEEYFLANSKSEDYALIFNFFYGDEASQSLEYMKYGIPKNAGFKYAEYLSAKRTKSI